MSNEIDFVLTWVDDSDPIWQVEKAKYDTNKSKENKKTHYRDWGTLRYWFRSVEKYAPWVHRIHFVTCGQTPEWLNTDHPKLNLVFHKDYMPSEYLPTFSANPIELNLHRIQGLSEKFVYFNDDTFLISPTKETDYFINGLPRDSFAFSALIPSVKEEVITHIIFNDLLLLNANISKKTCLRKSCDKWFSLRYGRDNFRTLYYLPMGKFSGFVDPHLPNAYLKSTFEEVWDKEGEYLDRVSRNRFRTKEDVNQYLFRYWRLVKGEFVPRSPKDGVCCELGNDNKAIEYHLVTKDKKMLCINDTSSIADFESQKKWLHHVMESIFPEKSSYEKN